MCAQCHDFDFTALLYSKIESASLSETDKPNDGLRKLLSLFLDNRMLVQLTFEKVRKHSTKEALFKDSPSWFAYLGNPSFLFVITFLDCFRKFERGISDHG